MAKDCKTCGDNAATRAIASAIRAIKGANNKDRFGIKERKAKDLRDG